MLAGLETIGKLDHASAELLHLWHLVGTWCTPVLDVWFVEALRSWVASPLHSLCQEENLCYIVSSIQKPQASQHVIQCTKCGSLCRQWNAFSVPFMGGNSYFTLYGALSKNFLVISTGITCPY